MASLTTQLKQLEGLLGTSDLAEWEQSFVTSVAAQVRSKGDTTNLSSKQVEVIDRIYTKHFA